jgi:hypothetical protein
MMIIVAFVYGGPKVVDSVASGVTETLEKIKEMRGKQ